MSNPVFIAIVILAACRTAFALVALAFRAPIALIRFVARQWTLRDRSVVVQWVADGDTVQTDKSLRIRVAYIDAPEHGQPSLDGSINAGQRSLVALLDVLSRRAAQIRPIDTDIYDRVVAQVFIGRHDVGFEMVKRGEAICLPNAPAPYRRAEAAARSAGLGFWSRGGIQAPVEWRAKHPSYLPDAPTSAPP